MRDAVGGPAFSSAARQALLHAVTTYAAELASESRRVAQRFRFAVVSRGCVELAATTLSSSPARGDTSLRIAFGGLAAGAGLGYVLEWSIMWLGPAADVGLVTALLLGGALLMAFGARSRTRPR